MATTNRHDAWQAGDSYDLYMGRWSRPIAARFVDWLAMPDRSDWLEVGCGTGALTAAILRQASPGSVLALDLSEGFLSKARESIGDPRVDFRISDASNLPSIPSGSRDVAVAGLVLNFIPDRAAALREMRRIVRPGGTVGFYVWDYPGGGVEFMRAFWTAAVALDPAARDLTEDRRFPFCTRAHLTELASEAGLAAPRSIAIEAPSVFADFEDYWRPFTLGAGPAPGYCASLRPEERQRLKERLMQALSTQDDGSIALATRAWAVKARVD